jgi:hypothetical protein
MLVDSRAHVLDVDIHQPIAPLTYDLGYGALSQAMEMADVERQTQRATIDPCRVERFE